MFGSDLVTELSPFYEVCGLGRKVNRHSHISYVQTDITDRSAVFDAIASIKPTVIIHTAAFTDADSCELDPPHTFLLNTTATEWIAKAGDLCGATLFFISSDYVFDGTKSSPYNEGDAPNPLNVYGHSKFAAEKFLQSDCESAWIIRVPWLFGANGRNFFHTIMRAAARGETLRVVDDKKGAPTYTKDLAKAFRTLIVETNRSKGCHIYHLANEGVTTWFRAAKELLKKMNSTVKLIPITSKELNRPAKRPINSVFDLSRMKRDFGITLPPWEDSFNQFWSEILEPEWQSLVKSHSH